MTLKKRLLNITVLSLSLIGLTAWTQQKVQASTFSQPLVTLGTSLTATQKTGTLDTLTAALDGASYNTLVVDGATLVTYLNPAGDTFTPSSGVWSSAMIQKTAANSGINVKILPYQNKNNITTITADQYKNVALTAGVSDMTIYVTSAVPIDGSGALAGVYAAFAKEGVELNNKQITAAQDEMSTLSNITQANKDKDGYSDEQLNHAVAGAKKEMAQKGSSVTDSEIEKIVTQQITNNNLTQVINANQKQEIIALLIKIRDSGALDSASFKKQASKLMTNIQSNAKNIFEKLNTEENRNWLENIWQSIVDFFSGLATWAQNLV